MTEAFSVSPNRGRHLKRLFFAAFAFGLFLALILVFLFENPPYDKMPRATLVGERIGKKEVINRSRSFYSLTDRAVFRLGAFLGSEKAYFRDGLKTRSFQEHVEAVRLHLPRNFGRGLHELRARTLEGVMHPAFRVYQWHGNAAPVLIYNHGASQVPFDGIFAAIFKRESSSLPIRANLIVIRAPYHRRDRFELNEGAATLSRFLAVMAVSVRLTEELVRAAGKRGAKRVVVAGLSFGGFIANRHHLIYNSAHAYVPLAAGASFADVFLGTPAASPFALKNPETIRKHLNFAAVWKNTDRSNVFPVLARHDEVSRLEIQGPDYGNRPVEIWDRGHITLALSFRALRYAILRRLLPEKEADVFKDR